MQCGPLEVQIPVEVSAFVCGDSRDKMWTDLLSVAVVITIQRVSSRVAQH